MDKKQKNQDIRIFIVDLIMIAVVLLNLTYIIFEFNWGFEAVRVFFQKWTPDFHDWYNATLHKNFLRYDLYFVAIFLLELFIRWGLAIYRHTYYRWFFYPFVHWYDVLGCIPLGAFRALRILRVVSMVLRLQKMGLIDLKKTYMYVKGVKYYKVLVEEISDRVVLNVLDGLQEEIQRGTPVTERMITDVIDPHRETLVRFIASRVRKVTSHNYSIYKEDIQDYLQGIIKEAVANNKEVDKLELIPGIGSLISKTLQDAVADITFQVVDRAIADLASENNTQIVKEVTDVAFEAILIREEDEQLQNLTVDIVSQAIELVKEHVRIQQWKLREEEKLSKIVEPA